MVKLHENSITGFKLSSNGKFAITGSEDCTIRVWASDFESLMIELKNECPIINADLHISDEKVRKLYSCLNIIRLLF